MTTLLEKFNKEQEKNNPKGTLDIRPGDTIKIHQKIKEGDKERIQIFEGLVIAKKHGKGISATITVRKVVDGVGVERVYPIHSPAIDKIEVIGHGKIRRAKLNYLRTAKGIKGKLKKKEFAVAIAPVASEEVNLVSEGREAPVATTPKVEETPK
jgi:large subunit ribosomal protein L19